MITDGATVDDGIRSGGEAIDVGRGSTTDEADGDGRLAVDSTLYGKITYGTYSQSVDSGVGVTVCGTLSGAYCSCVYAE